MPLLLAILSKHFQYLVIISSIGFFMLVSVIYILIIPFPVPKQVHGFPLKAGIKLLRKPALLLTSFFLFLKAALKA